ncbi:hypothetical protein [Bradyrhizobium sp.]|uniref:hypothetical protein n=1 Tax=Bradyrhizobium sp. TaxID=376 RepID=UPI003C38F121
MIVRPLSEPTGANMIAALDVVARPKASAALRANVRIIDASLSSGFHAPRTDRKIGRRETSIEPPKDNDGGRLKPADLRSRCRPFILLNEQRVRRKK